MSDALPLADQAAIRDVIARCAWALDTGDVEAFVACFSPGGSLLWDVFESPERWEGEHALRHFATFFRDQPTSAGRQHHVTNTVITASGEEAKAMSYVAVALRQGAGPHLLNVMGYYEDRFHRWQGQWRLVERVIRDWSGPILGRFAGQTGQREARQKPAALIGAEFPGPRT